VEEPWNPLFMADLAVLAILARGMSLPCDPAF